MLETAEKHEEIIKSITEVLAGVEENRHRRIMELVADLRNPEVRKATEAALRIASLVEKLSKREKNQVIGEALDRIRQVNDEKQFELLRGVSQIMKNFYQGH